MNSLRDIVAASPQLKGVESRALILASGETDPQPLGPPKWDWKKVERILIVRLRSIGDTVLTTPSILALRRFAPNAEIDILLENWVAPLLQADEIIERIITINGRGLKERVRVAREIRKKGYDVVYNLHGGTTATLLTRASGARHRVGYANYQYARLHNHVAPSPLELWGQEKTHSAEQQLALLGWTGVPVSDRPPTQLAVTEEVNTAVEAKLERAGLKAGSFVLMHPAAAFTTKQWSSANFAAVADFLAERGLATLAIVGPDEESVINEVLSRASARIVNLSLSLAEVIAAAQRARMFVGNDSGIAHIASAVGTPAVVIFGSSNIAHWRPWTTTASEVVYEEMPCQPCHGYFCEKFEKPECILRVPVGRVRAAIERVLRSA